MKNIEKFFIELDTTKGRELCMNMINKATNGNMDCIDYLPYCYLCKNEIKNWALRERQGAYVLTQFEYDTIKYWRENGYFMLHIKDARLYLRQKVTGYYLRLRPSNLYKGMFQNLYDIDFDDILNNCEIKF